MKKSILIFFIILLTTACSITINFSESKTEEEKEINKENTIGNINIETISVECKENPYTVTNIKAKITNNTNKTYEKEQIRILVHLNDGTIREILGYFGNNLKSGESRIIDSSIDLNLCNYKKIEYIK